MPSEYRNQQKELARRRLEQRQSARRTSSQSGASSRSRASSRGGASSRSDISLHDETSSRSRTYSGERMSLHNETSTRRRTSTRNKASARSSASSGSTSLQWQDVFTNLMDQHGPLAVLLGAAVGLIVLFALISLLLRGCVGTVNTLTGNTPAVSSIATSVAENTTTEQGSIISRVATGARSALNEEAGYAASQTPLTDILSEDLAAQLENYATTNTEARWIATHADAYAADGPEVQQKILQLAAEEPAATTYIRNWPERYASALYRPDDEGALPVQTVGQTRVPRIYQWDARWGYTTYSSASFGLTGCCPTAFSMVYQAITGKLDMDPYQMGILAQDHGYVATYDGTDGSFLINEAPGLGMDCTMLNINGDNIVSSLEQGHVLIANVDAGDFTSRKHFIVLAGLQDGLVVVNDPYSKVHSEMLWDADRIAEQTFMLLEYTAL